MKKTKIYLFVFALGLIISAFGQTATMELTFTATNEGQYVPLDSIFIENLTQGVDTTLYASDTLLVLEYTNVGFKETIDENTFSVSQNYPNPFLEKTEVVLNLPEKEYLIITILDILGKKLAQYENTFSRGMHSLIIYPGNEKYSLLTVTGKHTTRSIKMLNANNNTNEGEKCKTVYNGHKNNVNGFKSQKDINSFLFEIEDTLQYTAYANTFDNIIGSAILNDSPQADTNYQFEIIKGLRCPGLPTVTDIEGNIYNTVLFGDQCLMKENLKTATYQNSTPIPNYTDDDSWVSIATGAYVWYNNDISWKDLYGGMYNWYATVDPNGLCPAGWHVPSMDEWTELFYFVGGSAPPNANILKSCRKVNSSAGGACNTSEHPRWDVEGPNGTDDYGFSGFPGGNRDDAAVFSSIGGFGNWWSSTEDESITSNAWFFDLAYFASELYITQYSKHFGFSVRCLKD